MLVDVNSYIGHWPYRQRKYNRCAARLERMNRFHVDVSVVSNLNGIFYKNPQSANEELHQEIRSNKVFKDRFIPFAVINPIYASWRMHFETSTVEMGMKGIRLYPQYHGYDLTNASCVELVKRSRDRGLPVAIGLRMVDSRPSSWLDLDRNKELVDEFLKEVTVFISYNHANGAIADQLVKKLVEEKIKVILDSQAMLTGEEGLRDIRIVEAIYKSAATKQAVKLA